MNRRRSRRPRRKSAYKNIKNNTGAKAQSKQIAHLTRSVRQLQKEAVSYAQFAIPLEGIPTLPTIDTSAIMPLGDFFITPLTVPKYWKPIFQTDALTGAATGVTTLAPNKVKMLNFDLQLTFSPTDSLVALTPRIMRVWVLKLRKETAQDTLQQTDNMTTAGFNTSANRDENIVYRTALDGGLPTMVKFNPAALKVLAYREFQLQNIMEETANVDPDDDTSITSRPPIKRVRIKVPAGNELKPASGSFKEMEPLDVMANDRYYLCVNHGGWAVDDAATNGVYCDSNLFVNTKTYI